MQRPSGMDQGQGLGRGTEFCQVPDGGTSQWDDSDYLCQEGRWEARYSGECDGHAEVCDDDSDGICVVVMMMVMVVVMAIVCGDGHTDNDYDYDCNGVYWWPLGKPCFVTPHLSIIIIHSETKPGLRRRRWEPSSVLLRAATSLPYSWRSSTRVLPTPLWLSSARGSPLTRKCFVSVGSNWSVLLQKIEC